MAYSGTSEQGWFCSWSNESWCTTLDQAVNHVTDWLGSTITVQVINNIHIFDIVNFVHTV